MSTFNNNRIALWGLAGLGAVLAVKTLMNQWRKIDFQGKTVVITGGSRGLGLVLAREFAQEGANLAICARDEDELERAQADLELNGGRVFTYVCDLTDKGQVTAFIQTVEQEFGPVDVLVNNAGTILVTPIEHATEEDFREVMEVNFWAAFYTIQAVLPQMRLRRAGRIVNIASFGGKVSFPHLLPYSTSKFALVGYSEGLRAELVKDGIYVTTVCPGLMRTGSPRNAQFKGQNEKEYAWFKIGDSLPVLSKGAVESARQILHACRYGQAELIISLPAKVASAVHGLAPGLTSEVLSAVNLLLPGPGGIGEQRALGKDSETSVTRSVFTTWTDDAAEANNQYQW
ncbi:SDR family NAD(P)-dependent oxidoreductase [Larkinella sp. VNQ87]|uniref:SDR family NAD(P)-dependent oxidoreductase n=1 Tax=Larkinella sp. VNQ87 TaxID=3400921 RepID=UPI003BFD5D57